MVRNQRPMIENKWKEIARSMAPPGAWSVGGLEMGGLGLGGLGNHVEGLP